MEVMDTSLDKFYRLVFDNKHTIPENVLGKIALAVSSSFIFSMAFFRGRRSVWSPDNNRQNNEVL